MEIILFSFFVLLKMHKDIIHYRQQPYNTTAWFWVFFSNSLHWAFHFRLNAGFGVEPLLKDVKIINSQDVEADNLLVMIIIDITTRKTAAAPTTEIS